VYERGLFGGEDRKWDILLVQTGANNQHSTLETERAIQHFDPAVALFIGVAGGLKDVAIGDVLAATKVYGYESGKANQGFEPRTEIGLSSYALEQRAIVEAKSEQWLSRIADRSSSKSPRAFVGPIAAGEKVVADKRSSIYQFLRKQYSDALAVEMEGLGFLTAVRANRNVEALVVRGISDCIDGKAEADALGSQEHAARNASAFAFEILSKFIPLATASPKRTSGPLVIMPAVASLLLLGALGFMAFNYYRQPLSPANGLEPVPKTNGSLPPTSSGRLKKISPDPPVAKPTPRVLQPPGASTVPSPPEQHPAPPNEATITTIEQLRALHNVRPLSSNEDGREAAQLPVGVFGYVEIESSPLLGQAKVHQRPPAHAFEIHQTSRELLQIVGYVWEIEAKAIASGKPVNVVLSPMSSGQSQSLVSIPFARIQKAEIKFYRGEQLLQLYLENTVKR
jgi:nucleoside phosphorylase